MNNDSRAASRSSSMKAAKARLGAWWEEVLALLAPLVSEAEALPLADLLDRLAGAGEALCGEGLWANADGRAQAGPR